MALEQHLLLGGGGCYSPGPSLLGFVVDSVHTVVFACSDKSVLVWQLGNAEDGSLGYPKRALRGHSHYVQVRRRSSGKGSPVHPGLHACSAVLLHCLQSRNQSIDTSSSSSHRALL
jgi:hypothetical protein